MYDKYLVTGATGFLGRAVVEELARRDAQVRALVLPDDPYAHLLPKKVRSIAGDVCDKDALASFFADADSRTCVIHCAGIVSVASRPGPKLYQVNVGGTWRVLRQCIAHNVGKMIYVSSVHAIPEKPKGCLITEDCKFSPGLVDGDYAKSKATATDLVLDAAAQGLNASIIFPSGIIGPGDVQGGSFTSMGRMLQMVGAAANRRYRPICLPLGLARLAAPGYERRSLRAGKPLFFTPYSVSVLGSNGQFSHAAASACFAYEPRPMEETLQDMAAWLLR